MDWLDTLREIAPPPAEVRELPGAAERSAAEAALKVGLPRDYVAFAEAWGPAYVGQFFHVFAPVPGRNGLVEKARGVTEALSTLKAHHPQRCTAPVFPEAGGFLAWGLTDNGDFLGWMVTGRDPEAWPAAVWGEEDGTPEVFEGTGFGALLAGIVTGSIRPAAFPADVWDELPLTKEAPASERSAD